MNKFSCASFRFYASLNDFLSNEKRQQTFPHWFKGNPSIKDTIEAQYSECQQIYWQGSHYAKLRILN